MNSEIKIHMNNGVSKVKKIIDREMVRVMMINPDGSIITISSEKQLRCVNYFNEYYSRKIKENTESLYVLKKLSVSTNFNYATVYNACFGARIVFIRTSGSVFNNGYFVLPKELTDNQKKVLNDFEDYFSVYDQIKIDYVVYDDFLGNAKLIKNNVVVVGEKVLLEIDNLYVKNGDNYKIKQIVEPKQKRLTRW